MAVRIAGINIPEHKHIRIGLQAIYGIGPSLGLRICEEAKVNPSAKVKDLSEKELGEIRNLVAQYTVEGELRRVISMNIKRKMDLGTYQGRRHRVGLPVRGQRTRTNARTRKRKGKKN